MNYPWDSFRESPKYLDFHDEVKMIADEIEKLISAAPDWDAYFPVVDPAMVEVKAHKIGLPIL